MVSRTWKSRFSSDLGSEPQITCLVKHRVLGAGNISTAGVVAEERLVKMQNTAVTVSDGNTLCVSQRLCPDSDVLMLYSLSCVCPMKRLGHEPGLPL